MKTEKLEKQTWNNLLWQLSQIPHLTPNKARQILEPQNIPQDKIDLAYQNVMIKRRRWADSMTRKRIRLSNQRMYQIAELRKNKKWKEVSETVGLSIRQCHRLYDKWEILRKESEDLSFYEKYFVDYYLIEGNSFKTFGGRSAGKKFKLSKKQLEYYKSQLLLNPTLYKEKLEIFNYNNLAAKPQTTNSYIYLINVTFFANNDMATVDIKDLPSAYSIATKHYNFKGKLTEFLELLKSGNQSDHYFDSKKGCIYCEIIEKKGLPK